MLLTSFILTVDYFFFTFIDVNEIQWSFRSFNYETKCKIMIGLPSIYIYIWKKNHTQYTKEANFIFTFPSFWRINGISSVYINSHILRVEKNQCGQVTQTQIQSFFFESESLSAVLFFGSFSLGFFSLGQVFLHWWNASFKPISLIKFSLEKRNVLIFIFVLYYLKNKRGNLKLNLKKSVS